MAQATASLEEQLLAIRRAAEEKEVEAQAAKLGLTYVNLTAAPIQIDALKLVKEEEARRLRLAPFQFKQKELALAVADPKSASVQRLIQKLSGEGYQVKQFLVTQGSLDHVWKYYKYIPVPTEEITGKVSIEPARLEELTEKLTDLEKVKNEILNFDFKKTSTGQVLEVVLAGALNNRASDIHFETEEKGVRLRYRIDGLLHDVLPNLSADIYKSLLSRIKLLSNLKINVQDAPQDGRFTIALKSKEIELRVSIITSEYGETVVMRVLDPAAIRITMPQLGLRPDDSEVIKAELNEPNGMILNTGPTGSGKTTTLYAFLLSKLSPEIKIITIEDPIEYHLGGLEQTQVDAEAGYDFASGLRSIMRQDPDVILVGEIRDKETSDIAMQAALTGHLVFSTVHANSASGAIPRLIDLGAKPASIGPALNLIIAQRLVRKLCEHCKAAENASELDQKIKKFVRQLPKRVDKSQYEKPLMFKPKGCPKCGNIGYKGRVAIFELMTVGGDVESLITSSVGEAVILRQALKQGMVTMQQDGILKVISGITTFDEVESVTGPIKWES